MFSGEVLYAVLLRPLSTALLEKQNLYCNRLGILLMHKNVPVY